jgi:hypothetical protein
MLVAYCSNFHLKKEKRRDQSTLKKKKEGSKGKGKDQKEKRRIKRKKEGSKGVDAGGVPPQSPKG